MLLGQQLSYIFGIISNGLFMIVFIPQIYKNYKNKNADAISLSLLYCLILGLFSIISADYKKLNLIIIYSVIYFNFLLLCFPIIIVNSFDITGKLL